MRPRSQRMLITPGRIQLIEDGGGSKLSRLWDMARRIGMMITWNLRRRAYDKATGPLFLLVEPMMQALLFFYIVYIVFGVRGDDVSYMSIFTMVTLWRGHAIIVGSAPYYLSAQSAILQQSRYPAVALLAEGIGTDVAMFGLLILVVLGVLVIGGEGPRWTWIAFPLVLAVNLLFTAGCAVLISCAGVYLRETGILINFFVALWMYASPVVYGMERINEPFRTIYLWINPFAHIMPAYRAVLLNSEWPAMRPLLVITLLAIAMIALGLGWVERLKGRMYRYL